MKTLITRSDKTVHTMDLLAQEEIIEEGLRRFTQLVDSRADMYPEGINRMLRYIHSHLFEDTLTVQRVKTACGFTNNNITTTGNLGNNLDVSIDKIT